MLGGLPVSTILQCCSRSCGCFLVPLCGACLQFNAFNYWSVAFEPHIEYGESEGGISDEEEDMPVPVASVTGIAALPETQSPRAATDMQPPASQESGKRTLALNYYFGLDQAESSRASLSATHAATSVANLVASRTAGDTSSSSDSSEDPFDLLSSRDSSSSSSSSSNTSSSSSLGAPHLEFCTSVGIVASQQQLAEPAECMRRSASEGAELASLERTQGDNSGPEKQPQRPSTANAPGRLLLPSVVSISSFRLGPLGFGRVKNAAATVPAMQEAPAAATAGASASKDSTKPTAAVTDAAGSGSHPEVEGHLQATLHPKQQLPLHRFPLPSPPTKGAPAAVAMDSGHVLQPFSPGVRAAAILGLQMGKAEASGATQIGTRASEAPSASDGECLLAGSPEQHLGTNDTHLAGDSCGIPSNVLPPVPASRRGSISPRETRRSKSEDAGSACSPLGTGMDAAVNPGAQREVGGASAQRVSGSHATSSTFRRSLAPTHFTSARFSAGPPPASAVAPSRSATRLWLPKNTGEMQGCSITSAMFMALAQETPAPSRPTDSPKRGVPRNSFSAAFAAAGVAAKAAEFTARAAGRIRGSMAGSADGLGSYSSFESTDPLTSRCDSFASAASRTRNDDESHVQSPGQHQRQQKDEDGTAEDYQPAGNRSVCSSPVPRTASYESLLTGSPKEADAASPSPSRSSVS